MEALSWLTYQDFITQCVLPEKNKEKIQTLSS